MKMKRLGDYLSFGPWLIREESWSREIQPYREAIFAAGNGYLGLRGVLEEDPDGSHPGTYIAGLYGSVGTLVPEMVNLPNPLDFKLTAHGERLSVAAMDCDEHRRILDMRQGFLYRKTSYRNVRKNRFDYSSLRFLSSCRPNSGAMRVEFISLDTDVTLAIQSTVNTSSFNLPQVTEGKKRHYQVVESGEQNGIYYVVVETVGKKIKVAIAITQTVRINGSQPTVIGRNFELRAKRNQRIVFDKYFSIISEIERPSGGVKKTVISEVKHCRSTGINKLFTAHKKTWEAKWKNSDVVLKGDDKLQKAIRFNVYHLLVSGAETDGISSIGARTLSGEGYRGHIFWDTEIFILPFFIYQYPEIAKSILLYRYHRLQQAKENAKKEKLKGAKFPWESADTGIEVTPTWHRDLDGKIIQIVTSTQEIHITADVVYAVWHYFRATNDWDFLLLYGLELITEAARYYASVVQQGKKGKKYHIRNVMGPDEFHSNVSNNLYTNGMSRRALRRAVKAWGRAERKKPKEARTLMKKYNVRREEIAKWAKLARSIKFTIPRSRVAEQFDGYRKLKYIPLTHWVPGREPLPAIPNGLKVSEFFKTQLIKQPDVLMYLVLCGRHMTSWVWKLNYEFYSRRTMHRSSLSMPTHALIAFKLRRFDEALSYLRASAFCDLMDWNGNTGSGIHSASCGACWQAVVMGAGGIKFTGETLLLRPNLPPSWKSLSFNVRWKGSLLHFEINHIHVAITVAYYDRIHSKGAKVDIYGVQRYLKTGLRCKVRAKEKRAILIKQPQIPAYY